MKLRSILLSLCFLALFSYGQAQTVPELSRTCAPIAGDSLRYYLVPNPLSFASLLTQSGPSKIWNPGSALLSEQSKVDLYQNATQTPYFLLFGNYGRKIADSSSLFEFLGLPAQLPIPGFDTFNLPLTNLYDFYNLNNNRWAKTAQGIGLFGLPLPIFYRDVDEILNFPLRYNDRDTSTFSFEINIPTLAQISRSGRRISHADAWGSLTTPYGTFNCLRVRSRTSIQDSISISGSTPIGLPARTEIETSWYTNEGGNRGPILQIIEKGFFIFPPTVQEVRYRDRYRAPKPPPPPPLTDPGDVVLYPNPCQTTLYLGLHPLDPCTRISFTDMQGKITLDLPNPGPQIENIPLLLAPGCYQVTVEAQYGTYAKRLLVIP